MIVKKRPVLGAVSGFCFGLFLGLTLLGFGVYALDSIAIALLPVAGLVAGVAGALWAPLRRAPAATPTPFAAPPSTPAPTLEPPTTPED
jgi:hypothetical protein